MDSDRIYFRAASQTDANAIQVLAKAVWLLSVSE